MVDDWKGKKVKMVAVREVSGEDNGAVATAERPATMRELVKRTGKRIVHRSNIVEFNFLGWLSCKVKILHSTGFKAILAKSGPPFRTSCNTTISDPILKTIGSFKSELIPQTLPYMLDII